MIMANKSAKPGCKTCGRCSTEKPLKLFPVENARKDGRGAWCRQCHKEYRSERGKMERNSLVRQAAIIRKSARDKTMKTYSASGAMLGQCLTCGSPISEMSVIIGVPPAIIKDVLNGYMDLKPQHSERAALWLSLCWWRHCWRMGADGADDAAELSAIVSCAQALSVVSVDFLEDLLTALEDANLEIDINTDSIVTVDILAPEGFIG